MYKLLIRDDAGTTRTESLAGDEVTLGRREGNTIRLEEVNVSRRHARLVQRDGRFAVVDLASYNGTLVNGERIQRERVLEHGDRLRVGSFRITFAREGLPEPVFDRESRLDDEDDDDDVEDEHDEPAPVAPRAVAPEAEAAKPAPEPVVEAAKDEKTADEKPVEAVSPQPAETPTAKADAEPAEKSEEKSKEESPSAPVAPPPPLPEFRMTASVDALKRAARRGAVPFEVRQARLIFLTPLDAPPPVGLERLPLVLGSAENADVRLAFPSVQPEHARLTLENGELQLDALAPDENAVLVNGAPTRKATLSVNDMVKLGDVELRVGRRSYIAAVRPNLANFTGTGEPPPEPVAPSSRWNLAAGVLGVALTIGAAFVILRPSPTPVVPAPVIAPVVHDAGLTARDRDVNAPDVPSVTAVIDSGIEPMRPDETPAQRLDRAQQAADDLDYAQVLSLLAPLRDRTDLGATAVNVAMLETNAWIALGRDAEAATACARALRMAPDPDALITAQSPPVQAACRGTRGTDAGTSD